MYKFSLSSKTKHTNTTVTTKKMKRWQNLSKQNLFHCNCSIWMLFYLEKKKGFLKKFTCHFLSCPSICVPWSAGMSHSISVKRAYSQCWKVGVTYEGGGHLLPFMHNSDFQTGCQDVSAGNLTCTTTPTPPQLR